MFVRHIRTKFLNFLATFCNRLFSQEANYRIFTIKFMVSSLIIKFGIDAGQTLAKWLFLMPLVTKSWF